jgi:hypothetical protein
VCDGGMRSRHVGRDQGRLTGEGGNSITKSIAAVT